MDDTDLDLKITEPASPPPRIAPPPDALPAAATLTPLPAELLALLPSGPPPGAAEEPLSDVPTVTEAAFVAGGGGPVSDAGAHVKLTPLPDGVLPPPEPQTERRRRGDVPLPRLREAIRSPDEVARRRGRGGGVTPATVAAIGGVVLFVAAIPAVVWVALQQPPTAPPQAAPALTEQELMGIPVRRDLKLPEE